MKPSFCYLIRRYNLAALMVGFAALTTVSGIAAPTINVSAFPHKLTEAGQDATFTLHLSAASSRKIALNFVMTGMAREGENYVLTADHNRLGQIVIPAGSSSVAVTLHSLGGITAAPLMEDAVFNILAGRGYRVGSRSQAQVIIQESD